MNAYIPAQYFQRIDRKTAELQAARPFTGEKVQKLERAIEIEITYNSCRIEGSTLSLGETEAVLKGAELSGIPAADALMVKQHAAGWAVVKAWAAEGKRKQLGVDAVLQLHRTIYEVMDVHVRGVFRDGPVRVRGSQFAFPEAATVQGHVARLLAWFNRSADHPIVKAAALHWGLVTIHPFFDGNGRVARLLQDFTLLVHGYTPAIVRADDRTQYVAYLRKSQLAGEVGGFFRYIANKVEISTDRFRTAVGLERDVDYKPLAEWAKVLGLTAPALRTQALNLRLAAFKRGGDWYTTQTELNRYLQSRQRQRTSRQVVEGEFVAYSNRSLILRTDRGLKEIEIEIAELPKEIAPGERLRVTLANPAKIVKLPIATPQKIE